MHAVVNHMKLSRPLDSNIIERMKYADGEHI